MKISFLDVVQRFVLFMKEREECLYFLPYKPSTCRAICIDRHFLSINSNDTCEVCAPLPKQGLQVRRRGMGE